MSVTAARGFVASGVHCGIRREQADLAVVRSLPRATGGAMFTVNRMQAAPVKVSKEHLEVAAPATTFSAITVAPSPSATICCDRSAQTRRSASANASSLAGVRSTLLAPFASSTTASFVEHSPSTEIELNDASTAGRRKSSTSSCATA